MPWFEIEARLTLARASLGLGDRDGGRRLTDEAAARLSQAPDAPVLRRWLEEVEVLPHRVRAAGGAADRRRAADRPLPAQSPLLPPGRGEPSTSRPTPSKPTFAPSTASSGRPRARRRSSGPAKRRCSTAPPPSAARPTDQADAESPGSGDAAGRLALGSLDLTSRQRRKVWMPHLLAITYPEEDAGRQGGRGSRPLRGRPGHRPRRRGGRRLRARRQLPPDDQPPARRDGALEWVLERPAGVVAGGEGPAEIDPRFRAGLEARLRPGTSASWSPSRARSAAEPWTRLSPFGGEVLSCEVWDEVRRSVAGERNHPIGMRLSGRRWPDDADDVQIGQKGIAVPTRKHQLRRTAAHRRGDLSLRDLDLDPRLHPHRPLPRSRAVGLVEGGLGPLPGLHPVPHGADLPDRPRCRDARPDDQGAG